MNQPLIALALQVSEPDNSSMWIIVAVVLVILVLIVVVVGVGLTIFFIARKRSKAQKAAAAAGMSSGPVSSSVGSTPEIQESIPAFEPPPPIEAYTPASVPPLASDVAGEVEDRDFDPTRTVAINREATVAIDYGSIVFVSGVLSGQEFNVTPEGTYIGRDGSLSQIVVADPRISKRHLWIGVRDGVVTIADQESRNGTFVNDPRSERVIETALNPGDTVIMGESDVARFEYRS
jgi:type III secretion system (T3SS) inner membrane Yop/YscD-like protein